VPPCLCTTLQARSSSSSSTAAVEASSKQPKPPKQQKGKDVAAAAAAAEQQQQQQQQQQHLALLKSQYQRSRLGQFYSAHLSRELLLKLNVSSVQQLPRVRSVDLSISAKDTHGKRYVSGTAAACAWRQIVPRRNR
jgi:predicted secreted protein